LFKIVSLKINQTGAAKYAVHYQYPAKYPKNGHSRCPFLEVTFVGMKLQNAGSGYG
jgi:hypothetical protein